MVNRQNSSVRPIEVPIACAAMTAYENPAVIGERLAQRLADLRLSQAELARRIGVKQPSIAALISGKSQRTRHLHSIAKVLETSPEYLIGETDDVTVDAERLSKPARKTDDDDDTVSVQELNLAFGMGNSFLDLPVIETRRSFSRNWLRMFTHAPPSKIYLARGMGDSMAPTIHNDDIILIDATANSIRMSDQIWAFAYGDFGMIKRLRPLPDGGIQILSDNPAVPPATAYDGELHIIGKVVAIIRRMAA